MATSSVQYKLSGPWWDGIRAYIGQNKQDGDRFNGVEKDEWIDGWDEAAFYGGYGFYEAFKEADLVDLMA